MRRFLMTALCAAVILGNAAGPAVAQTTPELAAPSVVPDGWFVFGATLPTAPQTPGVRYYARDTSDGPALSVGTLSCDGGCDQLEGDRERKVASLGADGRLVRNGPWVWVTWSVVDEIDSLNVVAGRGLDDDEVIAAARAVRPNDGAADSIARAGLPRGFRELGQFDIGPVTVPFSVEHITLVSADGMQTIDIYTSSATKAERAALRFWLDQRPLLSGQSGNTTIVDTRGRVVAVTGDASPRVLRTIARSVQPVGEVGWIDFRRRVLDLPVAALFPAATDAAGTVIVGTVDTIRWGVGISNNPQGVFTRIVHPDGDISSAGSAGLPPDADPAAIYPFGGAQLGGGGLVPDGLMAVGAAPIATARISIEPAGQAPVDAVLAATGPDPEHRFFAAYLPGARNGIRVVAFDGDGQEIAHFERFECPVCQ